MALTKVTSGVRTIASSEVVTASIADDAVTLAKMAAGTDGNLISYDASGNPAAVATGDSGQVLTSQGAGAAPVFATTTLSTAGFTSAELTVTADTLVTSAHSLGAVPRLVSVRLVCKTIDAGYAVGDEIEATSLNSATGDQGATVSSNATNVYVAQASVMVVVGKASFNDTAITVGSWRWVIRAWA